MHINDLQMAIVKRRDHLGIDQRTLADLAGLSVRALSNIETGRGNPTLASINAVLEVLGLELELRVRRPNQPDRAPPAELRAGEMRLKDD